MHHVSGSRWRARWGTARRDGVGPLWRTGMAYALHDSVARRGRRPSTDWGRWLGGRQHPTVLPTADPGSTPGWEMETVAQPARFALAPVRAWQDTGESLRPVPQGEPRWGQTLGVRRMRVADATISPGQSLIVTSEHALVPEFLDRLRWESGLEDPGDAACLGPWRHRGDPYRLSETQRQRFRAWATTAWRASDAVESLPRAISLFEMVDSHFGHATLDILTRLRAVEDFGDSWPIVVSERMPTNVRSWISHLFPRHDVLHCPLGSVIRVTDLVIPLETGRLWHDAPRFPDAEVLPATIDPDGMRWLQACAAPPPPERHRRLWLRRDRSPNNTLEGESVLIDEARKCGFTPVYLEDLALDEARELLAETSDVIAPMGSAVANLALAAPGLRVLQLTDQLTVLDRLGSLTWLPRLGHLSGLLVGNNSRSGRFRLTSEAVLQAWSLMGTEAVDGV